MLVAEAHSPLVPAMHIYIHCLASPILQEYPPGVELVEGGEGGTGRPQQQHCNVGERVS